MPGIATTIFLPWAAAGTPAPNTAAKSKPPATNAMVLRLMESSLSASLFFYSAFKMEFGFTRLSHQRAPYAFAQLGETWFTQCLARSRIGQIDRDCLMDAGGPSLEHNHAMSKQDRFLDRVRYENHAGWPLFPDMQQLELQNFSRLRIDR